MKRKLLAAALIAALCLSFGGCSKPENQPTGGDPAASLPAGSVAQEVEADELFTDRDRDDGYSDCVTVTLSDGGCAADGSGVTLSGSTVTVTKAGTYRLTGTLSDGQIRVTAGKEDKVQLVLDGVNVTNGGSAALLILSGDKVFVTLAEGSENALASTGEMTRTEDGSNVDAAVFSKSDLTFNGSGSLTVTCQTSHGIVGKDDLKITGGTYRVTAAKQGMTGKDRLCIEAGSFFIESGTDGLHAKNNDDATLGDIYILGGTFEIRAGNDGLDASRNILIAGGDLTVVSGGGSASVTHTDGMWGGPGGWGGTGTAAATESRKGIKAAENLTVTGGTLRIDSEDDAMHTNGSLAVTGGTLTVASGDDALHADGSLEISGGKLTITASYEGIEGNYITVSGGEIDLTSSDDGLNAAGGNDGSGMAGPWGHGGGFGEAEDASILICGGTLAVNAGGDGIDSNGDLTVTGGTVLVDGPTNSGNGALDYGGKATITGGTVIALGASGMAVNFGTDSTQGAILYGFSGTASAGTQVSIQDAGGKVLASYTSRKTFQSVVISAPGMTVGETYTLTTGGSSVQIRLDSVIYGSGSGMGGMGGGRPGGERPGGRP